MTEPNKMKFKFTMEEACALLDGLHTLIDTYEEEDERVEELKWLKVMAQRMGERLGVL